MGLTKNLGTLAQGVFSDSSLNIGIGGAPSGSFKFEVTGTGKFSGALTGTSATFANTTALGISTQTTAGLYNGVAASASGSSFFTKTGSLSSSFSSGFGVDGTYSSGLSIINLRAIGTQTAGGYASAMHFVLDNDGVQRNHAIFSSDGSTTLYGALSGTSATFTGILTAGSSSSQTPASISTNSQANQPALTLFKNIFTGTGEDVFRIQSFNSGVVNVFTVKDNGATALSGALLGTSATFSGNVTANNGSVFVAASSLGTVFTVMQSDNTAGYLGTNSNHPLVLRTDSTERMRISSTGAATFKVGTNENVSISSVGGGDMRISALNDAVSATVQLSIQGSPLLFRTFGGVEAMRITSGGNVLIGTATDSGFKLDVNAGGGSVRFNGTIGDKLVLYNSGNNSGTNGIYIDSDIYPAIRFNNRVGNAGTAKIVYNTYATGYGPASLNGSFLMQGPNALQFSSGGDNVRLTIASTGESTFSGSLTMSAYSYASSAIQFTRAASNLVTPASGNGILVFAGGNAQMRMDTANQICFDMNNGGSPHTVLTLKQSDNTVSINSPNNNLPLELKYQNVASGYLGASGSALYAYSTNGGYVLLNASSVWVAASDAKRKRNFETYSNGLSAILGLQPKLYNMDFQKDGDEKQVGLVAQEVKDFIPKAYEDNNNFIGLNYNAIIVTMVNAIQELNAKITQLENK